MEEDHQNESENTKPERLLRNAYQIQQEYYETVGDADWELFETKDRKHLLQKIAIALFGPPTKEGNLLNCVDDTDDVYKLQGYEDQEEAACMHVFKKILERAPYSHNNTNLLISVLRIVCVIPSRKIKFFEITPKDYWTHLHYKAGKDVHIYVFHVFSIRKCISKTPGAKGCRIFIDHVGRVYPNWDSYLNKNQLPKCVMVVPKNGEYKGYIPENSKTPLVELTVLASPALGPSARVLTVVDKTSTVASIGALAGAVGAIFAGPVVAPVLVGTTVGVAVVTGVYSIGRSTAQLVDRHKHEQSIGLADSEARNCWLNILISTVGLSFSAASKLLTWAASTGTNVKILMNAVDFLKYTNLVTGFIGVSNGFGEMVYKYFDRGEKPTVTELFQFTTSALFLGLGAMSNQTAQEIVQDVQAKTINNMRDSLSSNTKRKIFDKVTAETRRNNGIINGNADVIKALKTIENKDEFFAKLNRINKQVNKNKVRISLSSDGGILVNNDFKHSLSNIHGLGKNGRNRLFAKYGPANVTTKNAATRICQSSNSTNTFYQVSQEASTLIRVEDIVDTFIRLLSQTDKDMLLDILSKMSRKLHDAFLLLCAEFLEFLIPAEIRIISSIFIVHKMPIVFYLLYYIKDLIKARVSNYDYENDYSIALILKDFIHDSKINKKTLLVLKKRLLDVIDEYKNLKDFRDHQDKFRFIYKYQKTCSIYMKTLVPGECIDAGPHKILISGITVDKLGDLLEKLSQEMCDNILNVSIKLIALLSPSEIKKINLFNPDEDIVIRVAQFLLLEVNLSIDPDVVQNMKYRLKEWYEKQKIRMHYTCATCGGMSYVE